ncbi:questin oxidase family protein [Isachenkonia alkalipeptolytica]|uniref:Questin oxidase family protein n=1 Tax=Isachenkonia alkalipeptolytica TaxID=2565777 RepID=A0AA43XKX6_9CLOT|nr:questin oxidase family protein [Isachenkonia alkalipeptolytica]NBG88592.1 questin oxidase family protein [Isachenkonia alkalipeptolytica]
MNLSQLINENGRKQSPYMEGLVNHLPMGQFALYQLTKDLSRVASYTEFYNDRFHVDPVSESFTPATSIHGCLGNREAYEACLALMEDEVKTHGSEAMIEKILNAYPLGMSSGLFHVTIRLAYGKEGASYDEALTEEISRALAYYVTAYRAVTPFHRKVPRDRLHENMNSLIKSPLVEKNLRQNSSLGKTMKTLYQSPAYRDQGFLIQGTVEEKVLGLLDLCLPAFDHTKSIVALHCITGLHALLVLKDYFQDFEKALDIYTTAVITHLLTIDGVAFPKPDHGPVLPSWGELIAKGASSKDVHTIKFTYTCHELYQRYSIEGLKQSLLYQIHK